MIFFGAKVNLVIRRKMAKKKKKLNKAAKKFKKIKKPAKPRRKILNKKRAKIRKIVKKPAAKKTVKKIEKAVEKNSALAPAESLFKAKIKVIGIGGGGGSIVSEIGRSLEKATFVIADTDARALKKRPGIKNFLFGENFTHGLGTGVNVELARKAAEDAIEKMGDFFKEQDIIIFVASLGGGLGSGATEIFARTAQNFGGITLGIFTLPFAFEGKNKKRIASRALHNLRKVLNVSITIPNEKIFKVIDANTSITQAFSLVNKNLIESLESLIDIIYNPGLINIDFADLRAILNGKGNFAFLNTVEGSGKDRADKILEKVFFNPLYQNNNFKADKILFNIASGSDLSMFEVGKISKNIAEKNPKAKIIFGISKNSKLKKKIKTTILICGPAGESALRAETTDVKTAGEPEKAVLKSLEKQKAKAAKKQKTKIKRETAAKKTPEILIPVFGTPDLAGAGTSEKKINIIESVAEPAKKTIRRNALDIKEAEKLEEEKRIQQEKEWEIPAFLRKVKFNK